MQSFRAALKCQPRHYQAWYGIGMVFQKQERLSSAEYEPGTLQAMWSAHCKRCGLHTASDVAVDSRRE